MAKKENTAMVLKPNNFIQGLVPNVKGMAAMDAVALMENMGMKVRLKGNGKVKKQSVSSGVKLKPKQTIILELS